MNPDTGMLNAHAHKNCSEYGEKAKIPVTSEMDKEI